MYHQLIEDSSLVTTQKSNKKIVPNNGENRVTRMQFDDISIDADDVNRLKDGASEIVSRLRPKWGTRNNFLFKIFSDGITNKLVGVFIEGEYFALIIILYMDVLILGYLFLTIIQLILQEEKRK